MHGREWTGDSVGVRKVQQIREAGALCENNHNAAQQPDHHAAAECARYIPPGRLMTAQQYVQNPRPGRTAADAQRIERAEQSNLLSGLGVGPGMEGACNADEQADCGHSQDQPQ